MIPVGFPKPSMPWWRPHAGCVYVRSWGPTYEAIVKWTPTSLAWWTFVSVGRVGHGFPSTTTDSGGEEAASYPTLRCRWVEVCFGRMHAGELVRTWHYLCFEQITKNKGEKDKKTKRKRKEGGIGQWDSHHQMGSRTKEKAPVPFEDSSLKGGDRKSKGLWVVGAPEPKNK